MLDDDGLVIRNISREDNGDYVCRAEVMSSGRTMDQLISVEVYGKIREL